MDSHRRDPLALLDELLGQANELLKSTKASPAVDLWLAKARSYLIDHYGADHSSLGLFESVIQKATMEAPFEKQRWERQQITLRAGIRLFEQLRLHDQVEDRAVPTPSPVGKPAVFVSHSGESLALSRLLRFISSCGLRPAIAEREAFLGDVVPHHVRRIMDECAVAVVFAESSHETATRRLPGPGVLVEAGVLQERFGNRVVYLVESGVDLGAMLAPFAYTSFESTCLEDAFERLIIEFRAHGLIMEASA